METSYDDMGYLIEFEYDGYRKHCVCEERVNDVLIYKNLRKDNRLIQMHLVKSKHHGASLFNAFK